MARGKRPCAPGIMLAGAEEAAIESRRPRNIGVAVPESLASSGSRGARFGRRVTPIRAPNCPQSPLDSGCVHY